MDEERFVAGLGQEAEAPEPGPVLSTRDLSVMLLGGGAVKDGLWTAIRARLHKDKPDPILRLVLEQSSQPAFRPGIHRAPRPGVWFANGLQIGPSCGRGGSHVG